MNDWKTDKQYTYLVEYIRHSCQNDINLGRLLFILQPFKNFFEKYQVKLILASNNANIINYESVNQTIFSQDSFHLFEKDKFIFIDINTFQNPNQDIQMMYQIFLDSNIASYINNKEKQELVGRIRENTHFLYNFVFYIIENTINSTNQKIVYRTICEWLEIDQNQSNISLEERCRYAKNGLNNIYKARADFERIFNEFYLAILKSYIISRNNKNSSLDEKLGQYFDFVNERLYIQNYISFIFVYLFFTKRNDIKFFNKLNQNKKSNIIRIAKNMAMDLLYANIKNPFYCDFIKLYKR